MKRIERKMTGITQKSVAGKYKVAGAKDKPDKPVKPMKGELKVFRIAKPILQRVQITIRGKTPLLVSHIQPDALSKAKGTDEPDAEPETQTVAEDTPLEGKKAKARGKAAECLTSEMIRAQEQADAYEGYLGSRYMIDEETHGFPVGAFKKAMVDACRFIEKIPMTEAASLFQIITPNPQGLVPLKFKHVVHHKTFGRNGNVKTKPLIELNRAEYHGWSCVLEFEFIVGLVNVATLINLLNNAGITIAVGCHRVQTLGRHGQFEVAGYLVLQGESDAPAKSRKRKVG